MLDIYKQLFKELDRKGCKYCLFKGQESIQANLEGNKDVDILVRKKDMWKFRGAARRAGFLQCNKSYPLYFIGKDASGKTAFVDVEIKIPIMKPVMYRKVIDWDKIDITLLKYDGISVPYAAVSWKEMQKKTTKPILNVLLPNPLIRYCYIIVGNVRYTYKRAISLAKRILQIPAYRCKKGAILHVVDPSTIDDQFYHLTGRKVFRLSKNPVRKIMQKVAITYLRACGNLVLVVD